MVPLLFKYAGRNLTIRRCFKLVKVIFAFVTDDQIEVGAVEFQETICRILPCCKIEQSKWTILKPSEMPTIPYGKFVNMSKFEDVSIQRFIIIMLYYHFDPVSWIMPIRLVLLVQQYSF